MERGKAAHGTRCKLSDAGDKNSVTAYIPGLLRSKQIIDKKVNIDPRACLRNLQT